MQQMYYKFFNSLKFLHTSQEEKSESFVPAMV
jgi:hypothetical protein